MGSIASQYNTSIISTFFRGFTDVIANSLLGAKDYFVTARAERELQLLDDRLLEDIGLNRAEITYAVRKGHVG